MTLLNGLVSLVTGGASGLGKETVKQLSRQGGKVVLLDLPESRGQEVSDSCGNNVIFAPCNITSENDVKNALSICEEKFSRLDVLINCAGVARAFKISNPVSKNVMRNEEIEFVYRTNVYGTFNVTRLAAKVMAKNEPSPKDKQRGVIINTGSVSSEDGCIGQSIFAASKGAIAAMTLPIARDLAPLGIRIVTISPSLFETPLTSEVCLTETVRQYLMQQMAFPKRFGDPLEFAKMVEDVIRNPMLNGEVIKLSAGLRFHVDVRTPAVDKSQS